MNDGKKSANGRLMRSLVLIVVGTLLFLLGAPTTAAETMYLRDFTVCAAPDTAPPDFGDHECAVQLTGALDPQGRQIWAEGIVDVPEGFANGRPLGLFISAAASSEAFVNGVAIGANGAPSPLKANEIPGRMDAVFHIPDGLLREGQNRITLRLSSHHGAIRLRHPTHIVAIGIFAEPAAIRLKEFWPSLITFGAFLAGALYFAIAAIRGSNRTDAALLALLAFFAAAQLLVENLRALAAYPYPAHIWRVIAIVVSSAGFGLTLAALVTSKFAVSARTRIMAATFALTSALIFTVQGFDQKAALAVLAPTIICAAIAARSALRGDRTAIVYFAALAAFAASNIIFANQFLDTVFYFEVAALLLVLFAAQAVTLERERRESALERARAHELEAALQRASGSAQTGVIRVNSAGSVNVVQAGDITHCKGAGDYVELHLTDGRQILHNGALAQLEAELPPTFLRVHRSFIVNTNFVTTLTRESTGVGALVLSNGAEIPVSRRIMPKVRDALI
jgi:DNA-binding LytR/AlgR family response regulator